MIQITDKLLAILVPEKSKNHSLTKFKTHTVIKYTDFLSDGVDLMFLKIMEIGMWNY